MASTKFNDTNGPLSIEPAEVYHANYSPSSPVKLRLAVGGAGQSGLIRALSDAFINHKVKSQQVEPFAIAWYASDTSQSFNYLAQNVVDMSVTYHAVAEQIAISQGIADRWEYAFRDHWMIVGPKSNPAKLSPKKNDTVYDILAHMFRAAIETMTDKKPVRFLSRFDKSAANIKESNLWSAIGQTPWSYPYSHFYHRYVDFPFRALEVAAQLEEYTLTDRGTWFSVDQWIRDAMTMFIVGGDDESDPLLNPAHVLVGKKAINKALANEFTDWLINPRGGQEVLKTFSANGVVLYSLAPGKVLRSKL